MRGARGLVLGLALGGAGCGAGVEPQLLEPWASWEVSMYASPPEPMVIALVVDDRPTAEAVRLRQTVGEALRTTLDNLAAGGDPAEWRPVDWTVVLALPSVPASERLIGPAQVPGFSVRSRHLAPESVTALADRVVAELEMRIALPEASYRPIEAAAQLGQILHGVRPPLDTHAAAVVEATAREEVVYIGEVLATTGDDESPAPVTAYPMPPWLPVGDRLLFLAVVMPSPEPAPCWFLALAEEPPSRLRSWIDALAQAQVHADVRGWPCGAEELVQRGLPPLYGCGTGVRCTFGGGPCSSRPIAMQGPMAECLIVAETPAVDRPCEAERGWRDPLDVDGVRRPRFDRDERGDYRVCEVRQLEGEALEACRTTVTCDGCPSGWCRAEGLGVHEIDLGGYCPRGEHHWHLRFVGGALAGAGALLRVRCELVP